MVIFGCIEATSSVYNENYLIYTPIMTLTLTFLLFYTHLCTSQGKKVPKLSFDNLRLAVALTLQVTLTFDHVTKKWLLPSKNFNLRILSFKGPYGINRRYAFLF